MKSRANIHDIYRWLGHRFRAKRAGWLRQQVVNCDSILDVGGDYRFWRDFVGWKPPRLALLNLTPFAGRVLQGAWHIQADALALPLTDQSFDLAMSNSVIEHVPDQAKFASEMMRVGKAVYCQTPSKWFPIEPHCLGLFVHWLPKQWFTHAIHRYLTLHGLLDKPDQRATTEFKKEVHLLGKKDLRQMFPGCTIMTERFLGLPKSYVVLWCGKSKVSLSKCFDSMSAPWVDIVN